MITYKIFIVILIFLSSCNYYSEKTYKYELVIDIDVRAINKSLVYADSINLTGPTHFKYWRDGIEYSISNNIPIEIRTNTAYTGK
jgi:hypothetical protein